jgi:hypothetical protein
LVVVIDELNWTSEQAAARVDILLPYFQGDQHHLPARGQGAGQRHAEPDLNRIGRARRIGRKD